MSEIVSDYSIYTSPIDTGCLINLFLPSKEMSISFTMVKLLHDNGQWEKVTLVW